MISTKLTIIIIIIIIKDKIPGNRKKRFCLESLNQKFVSLDIYEGNNYYYYHKSKNNINYYCYYYYYYYYYYY